MRVGGLLGELDVDDSPHVWASIRPARLVYLTRTASAWPSRVALACSDRALGLAVVGCAIPCATRHVAQRREEGLARGRRSVVALRIPTLLTVLGQIGARAYQSTSICTRPFVWPRGASARKPIPHPRDPQPEAGPCR